MERAHTEYTHDNIPIKKYTQPHQHYMIGHPVYHSIENIHYGSLLIFLKPTNSYKISTIIGILVRI